MKRSRVSWSNAVDLVEGPCAVCGKEVQYLIPSDRPDPAMLYHATCDMMPLLREQLKKASPPRLAPEYTVRKPTPAATAPSSHAAPATSTPPTPPVTPPAP